MNRKKTTLQHKLLGVTAKDDVDTILSVLKSKIHLDLVKKGNEYQELLFDLVAPKIFQMKHR